MRLWEHIAGSQPLWVRQRDGTLWRLPSACDFGSAVGMCSLRYALSNELVRMAAEIAYLKPQVLARHLPQLRFPATRLWIEWDETARCAALSHLLPGHSPAQSSHALRSGVLIQAQTGLRCGQLRSFWMTRDSPALVSAVETRIDLDRHLATASLEAFLQGDTLVARDPANAHVSTLLRHAGFRLDPGWQRYYRSVARDASAGDIVRGCLAGVASDVPVILALFFLLSGGKDLTVPATAPAAQRTRARKPVFVGPAPLPGGDERRPLAQRRVRGHLVRRGDAVFWRRSHWRSHHGALYTHTAAPRPPGSLIRRGRDPGEHGSGGSR